MENASKGFDVMWDLRSVEFFSQKNNNGSLSCLEIFKMSLTYNKLRTTIEHSYIMTQQNQWELLQCLFEEMNVRLGVSANVLVS